MRRFLRDIRFSSLPLPETLKEEFASHFDSLFHSSSGSLLENDCIFYHSSDVHPSHTNDYSNLTLPNQFIRSSFDDDMISTVFNLYKKLYPSLPMENIVLPSCFLKYKCMTIMNRIYYSSKNPLRPQLYFAQDINGSAADFRPVIVEYFILHTFQVEDQFFKNYLACVKWLKHHPCRYKWGKPLEIWYQDKFESDGDYSSLMPVHHLGKYCVYQSICHSHFNVYLCTSTPV